LAARPVPFDLAYLTNLHREEFVKFELWVSDDLTEHLIRAKDLDPSYTTVVVDLDQDEPLGDVEGQDVKIRLNGRFYMPDNDKKGISLGMEPSEWVEIAKAWFEENEVEVTFVEDPEDLVKFTAFVAAITLPEGVSGGDEGEAGDEVPAGDEGEGDEVPAGEGDEVPAGEEDLGGDEEEDLGSDEGDEGGEEPGDDEEGLKEFEKSLGL